MSSTSRQEQDAKALEERRQRMFVAWTRVEFGEERQNGPHPPAATEVWLRRNGSVFLRGPQFERMANSHHDGLGIDGAHWSALVDAVSACRHSVPEYGRIPSPTPYVDVRSWKEAPADEVATEDRIVSREQVDPLRGILDTLAATPTATDAAAARLTEAYTVLGNFLDNYDKATR